MVEMTEASYDSEDLLQGLLARYPNLLAGDQMDNAIKVILCATKPRLLVM